jgi:hypothetical protein
LCRYRKILDDRSTLSSALGHLFTVFAVNGVLDVKADTSGAIVGFNLHFRMLARNGSSEFSGDRL